MLQFVWDILPLIEALLVPHGKPALPATLHSRLRNKALLKYMSPHKSGILADHQERHLELCQVGDHFLILCRLQRHRVATQGSTGEDCDRSRPGCTSKLLQRIKRQKLVLGMQASDEEDDAETEASTAELSLSDILGVLNKPEKQVCLWSFEVALALPA